MYVRCAIDVDYPSEPRDFILGMIKEINRFSETAIVEFFDLLGLNIYYNIPATIEFPLSRLQHCRVSKDTLVSYNGRRYIIAEHTVNKSTGYFWYYVISEDNTIKYLCESDITASFNAGAVSPISQLKQYEFQNPVWYFGRKSVLKTTRAIENAFYGFNLLAGCKIFLKPHQLKTVQRCLSDKTCRYMLADEVGLGKTIEAASVLKIYLSNKHNKKVLIYVPDALVEQWKTELAFKFGLFIGKDKNNNILEIKPYSLSLSNYLVYDFVVMDEVHSLLNHREKYNQAMAVSKSSENVIMLSATPVQSRNEEYHRLLSLIQPEKYEHMPKEDFLSLLELQSRIIRKVHSLLECLTDYKEAIEDSDHEHTDDTEEAFDELLEVIEEIYDKVSKDMKAKIMEYGENALFKLGIAKMEPELIELVGRLNFRTSFGQNALTHSIEVASLSGIMASEVGENVNLAKRAGLLHDIGKSVDHEIEGSHVEIGSSLAKKYKENSVVINAIESHHGDTEATSTISALVAIADALSASRPGARSDSLENYIQRMQELEGVANRIDGVDKAFAMQAGRELRVVVKPEKINDAKAHKIARDIKNNIESELQYPGTIKVTVIRETRAVEEAK